MAATGDARVLVVDDEGDLRGLLRTALGVRGGFEVVGEAADGATGLAEAERTRPDIVILDLELPDLRGVDLLGRLVERVPEARVVVFSGTADRGAKAEVLAGGAAGFVHKSDLDRLLDVLQGLARERPLTDAVRLAADAASARGARRFVRGFCAANDCADVLDAVELVVSELVTNAVVHAESACELRLRLDQRILRVEIEDEVTTAPSPREADADAENGRGLALVGAMSEAWGVERNGSGKVIWSEIARTGPSAGV